MYKIAEGHATISSILADWEPHLAEFVYTFVADDVTGHDIYHCLRVKRLALHISEKEGLDSDVMAATAYLHDIGRPQEKVGIESHIRVGISAALEILPKIPFPTEKIERVIHCIQYHESYKWAEEESNLILSREALGFQDADRLDSIGAIGIARTFSFGGFHRRPLWIPEIPLESWQDNILGNSSYNHIFEKIIKLKDNMNTDTGRHLAQVRHRFTKEFIEEFEKEWQGTV